MMSDERFQRIYNNTAVDWCEETRREIAAELDRLRTLVKELEEIDGAVVGDGSVPYDYDIATSVDEAIEAWIDDDGEGGPCDPGVYDIEVHTWKCFPLRRFRVTVPDNETSDGDPTWEEVTP
jgi:hypothetical protein